MNYIYIILPPPPPPNVDHIFKMYSSNSFIYLFALLKVVDFSSKVMQKAHAGFLTPFLLVSPDEVRQCVMTR